jgi:TRAP-type C4-dicarboxylate transport system substrate-binding protein
MSQAFATGVVDGLMTSPSSCYNNGLYEFLKYGYDVRAALPKDAVLVNAKMFDALDPKLQKAVLDAASRAQKRGWEMSEKETSMRIAQLREKGMDFQAPSESLKQGFREIGAQLAADWKKAAGATGEDILRRYETK